MTDLVVRKMSFEFDTSVSEVPFLWQPANPHFAIFCNAFTFIAVPFEKYIIAALRQAQDRLAEDPEVAAEADAFLRQEAQHSAAHRKHMLALIEQYPGLQRCYDQTMASYQELIAAHPVEFHAAYIANLEATFTPMFKVILDHRDSLFGGADQRVAALMMWHFVEEIEHRSSGLRLYRHLMPDPWYRVKRIRHTFRHVGYIANTVARAFDECIPLPDRGTSAEQVMADPLRSEFGYRIGRRGVRPVFHAVPDTHLIKMLWRLALSQTPYHDPADQPLPQWAATWMAEYDRGTDMTTYAGG
ncbi:MULTISPECIES: metal-dependent hydrolase [Mycobacterium]|uniref:Metal-dependent hydrolase n=1 Tax=Mycobacterium kiyosense TaxID=2871094 RepID=A0A9P3QA53_9MYCO|nr:MULTISPECIES: metal-dependent hydrolase [Mycobacterium]BDB41940.1 metal-dependent hydrolase [Mycobacterium kiyosense]BDE14775.1 metal-dependent hydrolase [Mycobacterium sp. 20KCMC460]GLB84235.1 metal-dependent hydrolase [Mycobacterium kiyosense]GLB91722.1 metal-dependent hydrolase [Mycobacterium kiyosense]GLB96761.1 metal-dependent hydrolase [Mycobacterium kiyosense]